MSDKYAALREEIANPAISSKEHLRKLALKLLDELAERDADRARIAELEARTLSVKLPQGYVIREGHPINEGERHVMVPKDGGDWLSSFDVELALLKAGISLKIEGE